MDQDEWREIEIEFQLQLFGPFMPLLHVYQSCITYSVYFRIAPLWSRITDVWIRGRDFLASNDILQAVTWEPTVSGLSLLFCTYKPT